MFGTVLLWILVSWDGRHSALLWLLLMRDLFFHRSWIISGLVIKSEKWSNFACGTAILVRRWESSGTPLPWARMCFLATVKTYLDKLGILLHFLRVGNEETVCVVEGVVSAFIWLKTYLVDVCWTWKTLILNAYGSGYVITGYQDHFQESLCAWFIIHQNSLQKITEVSMNI